MEDRPIEISIIVVNYNTQELLRNCLASLMQTEGKLCQIIVVDNASTDGSPRMVEEEFPGVLLIQNATNLGFSKANNQGIRQAMGKYVLLLNSDTVVYSGALCCMAEFLDSQNDAGAVTCRLLNADGTIQACVSTVPGPLMLFLRFLGVARLVRGDRIRAFLSKYCGSFVGNTIQGYLAPYTARDNAVLVDNISGACLMLRRQAIEDIGLLDEHFFMYFEDMDYCRRLAQQGWKLYYVPGGKIKHLVGRSSNGRMRHSSVISYNSLFYYYRKYYSRWNQAAAITIVFVFTCLRLGWNSMAAVVTGRQSYRKNLRDLWQIMRRCIQGFTHTGEISAG